MLSERSQKPRSIAEGGGYLFDLKNLNSLFDELILSDRSERLRMKGLIEMRVDMIVISVLLTRCVLKHLHLKHVRHSSYALKEGVLSELMEERV
jgi:exopolyphosphatase/guanosine-5'-triphosphate,3'-diphosphate pyrophosphatase